VGKRIEALKRHGGHGTYMDRIEALGIKRTSAQNYRDLARFAVNLKAEPDFASMSLNDAKARIADFKAALKDDDDLDTPIAPSAGGKPKALRARRHSRTVKRTFSRLVQYVRENRYTEPDLAEHIDHGIARLQHVMSQDKRSDVVDAEAEDQAEG